jgi:hypothetical protein
MIIFTPGNGSPVDLSKTLPVIFPVVPAIIYEVNRIV